MNDTNPTGTAPRLSNSRSSSRGEETRAALVAAGLKLFTSRGFDGTSVRDITREAGVNLGSVTYHFGSKRGLYEAVLEAGLNPLVERIGQTASQTGSPLDRLEAAVDVFWDHLAANPQIPRLLLQELAAGKTPPDAVVRIIQRNAAYMSAIVSDGWEDGTVRSGSGHPLLFALSVVSQPLYFTIIAPLLREVGGLDLQDQETRRFVADHLKTFVRAGLESREETHA